MRNTTKSIAYLHNNVLFMTLSSPTAYNYFPFDLFNVLLASIKDSVMVAILLGCELYVDYKQSVTNTGV